MEKYLISKEMSDLYKSFLKVEDIEIVANTASEQQRISTSTLYNVVNRRYPVNNRTSHAIKFLNIYLYEKLIKLHPLIGVHIESLKEKEEVKNHILKN